MHSIRLAFSTVLFAWAVLSAPNLAGQAQEQSAPSSPTADPNNRLSTIVEVLKFGRGGQRFVVQGEITAMPEAQKININDGTFQMDVYLSEELQRLRLRPGDVILVEGVVQAVFLRSNVLIATAIQRIDKLLPKTTKVKKKMPTYPERISSDPDAVTRIRDINWYAAGGQFVNVIGKVRREVEPNALFILQDESGEIAVELPDGYKELKLYEGDRLRIRARVELNEETASKKLLAVFIDSINNLPSTFTPKIHIEAPQESATQSKQLPSQGKPKQITTKPVFISGPGKTEKPKKPVASKPNLKTVASTKSKPAPANTASSNSKSPEDRLLRLKRLLDKGLITEAEYNAKRAEIISEL